MGGEHGGGSRRKRWQPDCIGPFSKARFDFQSVQSLSRVQLFATPRTALQQVSLSITTSQSLLKLRSIVPVMPSNHLILCRPLLPPPSIFPSIRVFSNESVLHTRWPKYWSFSFSGEQRSFPPKGGATTQLSSSRWPPTFLRSMTDQKLEDENCLQF